MNIRYTLFVGALAALMFSACDEETGKIGIPSDRDTISSVSHTFEFTTRSLALDSVVANSSKCYLGQVHDPETGTDIRAEFVTQFYAFENYSLPDEGQIVKTDGMLQADSVELRLYFNSYYGEANNAMKIWVYELDRDHILKEDTTYYADMQIESYLPANAGHVAEKVFSPSDYTLTDADRTSSTHDDNVRIRLPQSIGTRIMKAALEHPEYFLNSWQFTHHVCPGFYFKLCSGVGTMLTLDVSALNVYFRYHGTTKAGTDTIYNGLARFSATPEVIQTTRIQNEGVKDLLSDESVKSVNYTYLKSPAGIATELTLPVDEIFEGHELDSISRARIILTRCNSKNQTGYELDAPQTLLMLRKQLRNSFFRNREVSDGEISYTTTFDSNYNTYTFTNVARLLSYLHREKQRGMLAEGMTSAEWNLNHPDWNRVVVIPVTVTTTTNQSTGISTIVSVSHDFSLSSARLVGGTQPLQMQVIYSRYE
ncbi:MAG: DUF4270 domain-containing protein [Bacteroidaceae bacterium]|nr:DUF4270 domain-containing protein [Bacteroidaceae bacterium]